MMHTIKIIDLNTITDIEATFGTERFLPEWNSIPKEFKDGNVYTEIVEGIFFGTKLPNAYLDFMPGMTPKILNKAVHAHLISRTPKHEHKIAGVGFLISKFARIKYD